MNPSVTIAVIAHVDHGKTTLVDALLKQGGAFETHEKVGELLMDSGAQEKERGITITSKNCAISWKENSIHIVDTPGHADFGSEVERVLRVVDTVLLLVDAKEGPMPQTRFVTQKALELGLKPIVVINKIDKEGADPDAVHDAVFDLFVELGATDEQLDFPMVLAVARDGIAKKSMQDSATDLSALFETIVQHATAKVKEEGPMQALVFSLAYDDHLGRLAVARVLAGTIKSGQRVKALQEKGDAAFTISSLMSFAGMSRRATGEARYGDIVVIAGCPGVTIGDTIAEEGAEALPRIAIGEPTVSMRISANTSPLAGREGSLLTSRQILDRLNRELETNVGLNVSELPDSSFEVAGRGELHLSVLVESMRREGFELSLSRPKVLFHEVEGVTHEPLEAAVITCPDDMVGGVMEALGTRRADITDMHADAGYTRISCTIPTRGLIGYRSQFVRATRGEGSLTHRFVEYGPHRGDIPARGHGVLISQEAGEAAAFALFNLQQRGELFIGAGTTVYEGMIIGASSRSDDLVVNPIKGKKLTNMRASGSDDALRLTPPRAMTLETAIEFLEDDELLEVTPSTLRLRKTLLTEVERKRAR